ncbi:MAG: A/G-specific adenine glycosylase [Sphingopyxis sp.]
MDVESAKLAREAIIAHYAHSARRLPWRTAPGDTARPDPYRVWLSEVMLQQTTVTAVIPYFERFTARWPTLTALAAADSADVLGAWAGLGYYSRARNLIACARTIVAEYDGRFPSDEASLRRLPGVGDYTAAAIAAIGFGQCAIPIDANVTRVVARLFAITTPLPEAKGAVRDAAVQLWPMQGGGDFAQALMDLGAGACSTRAPRCATCPASSWCMAHRQGIAETLPIKPAKKPKPERHGRALWIAGERDGVASVWLVRRPPRGLLGGMRALPSVMGPSNEWSDTPPPPPPGWCEMGAIRHIFTHFALTLVVERSHDAALAVGEGEWWPISRLDEAGLPSLYRRAADLAIMEQVR